MTWQDAVERKLLACMESVAPNPLHLKVSADRLSYCPAKDQTCQLAAGERLQVPAREVQYYLRKLEEAGFISCSFLSSGDINHIALTHEGHKRLSDLRSRTFAGRVKAAIVSVLSRAMTAVILPLVTAILTVIVMSKLGLAK